MALALGVPETELDIVGCPELDALSEPVLPTVDPEPTEVLVDMVAVLGSNCETCVDVEAELLLVKVIFGSVTPANAQFSMYAIYTNLISNENEDRGWIGVGRTKHEIL